MTIVDTWVICWLMLILQRSGWETSSHCILYGSNSTRKRLVYVDLQPSLNEYSQPVRTFYSDALDYHSMTISYPLSQSDPTRVLDIDDEHFFNSICKIRLPRIRPNLTVRTPKCRGCNAGLRASSRASTVIQSGFNPTARRWSSPRTSWGTSVPSDAGTRLALNQHFFFFF